MGTVRTWPWHPSIYENKAFQSVDYQFPGNQITFQRKNEIISSEARTAFPVTSYRFTWVFFFLNCCKQPALNSRLAFQSKIIYRLERLPLQPFYFIRPIWLLQKLYAEYSECRKFLQVIIDREKRVQTEFICVRFEIDYKFQSVQYRKMYCLDNSCGISLKPYQQFIWDRSVLGRKTILGWNGFLCLH